MHEVKVMWPDEVSYLEEGDLESAYDIFKIVNEHFTDPVALVAVQNLLLKDFRMKGYWGPPEIEEVIKAWNDTMEKLGYTEWA